MNDRLHQIFADHSGTDALAAIVDLLRPQKHASTDEIDARIYELVDALEADSQLLETVETTALSVLGDARLVNAFAESGILRDIGFLRKLNDRLVRRVLPRQLPEQAARRRILAVFRKPSDWKWVTNASVEAWTELFALIGQKGQWKPPYQQVGAAIEGLAQRIAALGIDEELNVRISGAHHYDSAFVDLPVVAHQFVEHHRGGDTDADSFDALVDTVDQCRDIITTLRSEKQRYGTNLRLTTVSRRLLQQLRRLTTLAHLIHPESPPETVASSVRLFQAFVEAELTDTSISRLFKQGADLLAYQIAEQSATKGQNYITDSRAGYFRFLRAAMQGGAIVAPFAVLKIFLSSFDLAPAAQGFVYGLNYAICFTLLYLTGSILATKQPAVTASAIARKIDEAAAEKRAIEGVADVIILVWRSQFVSFLGNLICALPLGFLLAYALANWGGAPVADAAGVDALVDSVHPWAQATLFYAAIAGICLFLSGVISGAVDNHVVYADVERRIAEHPGLTFLGDSRRRVAAFVAKHLGMTTGNVVLGFMLGFAGVIGTFLGLPIDIRHIAFSATDVGIVAHTAPEITATSLFATALLGVVGIGFFNFLICFVLTLTAGLEARRTSFDDARKLLRILVARALRRPWEWFLPHRKPRYRLPEGISEDRQK